MRGQLLPEAKPADAPAYAALLHILRLRTLPLLWAGYFMMMCARVNIAFAELEMAKDLDLSEGAFGFASGAFYIGYIALQVPSNHLAVRYGARRVLAGVVFLTTSVSCVTGLVQSDTALVLLRLLLGLAESGYYACCFVYVTRAFPPPAIGSALAIISSSGHAAYVGGRS